MINILYICLGQTYGVNWGDIKTHAEQHMKIPSPSKLGPKGATKRGNAGPAWQK